MNVEVSIDELGLEELVNGRINEIRIPVQTAMAEVFELMVKQNIGGEYGEFRPHEWDKLSKGYAKRVKRPYATLELSGGLLGSIGAEHAEDASTVFSIGCDYAAAHQYGEGFMPPRPFFPMTGDAGDEEITPQALNEVETAARLKIEELLK